MDLLIGATNFPPKRGGIERFLAGLAAHAWPDSTVVVASPVPGNSAAEASAHYAVERAPMVGSRPPRWWPARQALSAALRAHQPRFVLAGQRWPEGRALLTVGRGSERRAVLCHGTDLAIDRGAFRSRRLARRTLASFDLVLANSHFTAGLVAGLGSSAEVLNPGVDLDAPEADAAEVTARYGLGHAPYVITVARLVPRKGHAELLAHWERVQRQGDVEWLIVGDGPERERIAEAAQGQRVRLVGEIPDPDVRALMRGALAHVLPGRSIGVGEVEGFGMVVTEAGACGTPTVATASGGTAEAVGGGGIVVAEGRLDLLADALLEIVTDPARRAALGATARLRAEELAWPRVADRFRSLLEAS